MIARRLRFALVALAALCVAVPARAQSPSPALDRAKEDAALVKTHFEKLARAYADQLTKLNLTQQKLFAIRTDVTNGLVQKAALEAQLEKRVRAAYSGAGLGFFEMLLNPQSFQDFSVRYMALQRQSTQDAGLILKLRRERGALEAKQRQLADERGVESEQTSTLRAQAGALTVSFAQAELLLADLEGKLKPEQVAELFRMGGGPVTGGMRIPIGACPVRGLHFVVNDFLAPRDGGVRKHQGNDIMAPMGTPIVAPLSGTISLLQTGGKGGLAIFEKGVGNVVFYFAHEQEIGVQQGQEVTAGQEIGNVGNTGNAAGGAPHLHFEIHPGGGPAIDPYPTLSAVC